MPSARPASADRHVPYSSSCVADHVAVYPAATDGCWVDDERVEPQPGGFYGGWITSRVTGPF